jgi:hypothetical protein
MLVDSLIVRDLCDGYREVNGGAALRISVQPKAATMIGQVTARDDYKIEGGIFASLRTGLAGGNYRVLIIEIAEHFSDVKDCDKCSGVLQRRYRR